MGLGFSKNKYQNCNDDVWMDKSITIDFEKSSAQDLDRLNVDHLENSYAPPSRNKFMMFFVNIGNKFKMSPANKGKKFDDIELDSISLNNKVSVHETLFGKLKSTIRPRKFGVLNDDDTEGLVV